MNFVHFYLFLMTLSLTCRHFFILNVQHINSKHKPSIIIIMKKYCIISTEKRQKFIRQVVQLNLGLAKTARKLKIKLSTAKSILRAFRNKGKILRKKYIKRTKAKYTSNVENLLPQKIQSQREKVEQLQQIKLEHIQSTEQARPAIQQFPIYYFYYLPWMNMMNYIYP